MRLIIATHNKGKTAEFKDILSAYYDEISDLNDLGIADEAEETGSSLEENAIIKAEFALRYADNCDIIADDSGLCVDYLNGAPSIYSSRYAGENATHKQNRDKLLADMADAVDRKAHFETCLVMIRASGKRIIASGRTDGEILKAERGTRGFGYDCVFYSYELGKSFAEGSLADKDKVSHRSKAIECLLKQLNDNK